MITQPHRPRPSSRTAPAARPTATGLIPTPGIRRSDHTGGAAPEAGTVNGEDEPDMAVLRSGATPATPSRTELAVAAMHEPDRNGRSPSCYRSGVRIGGVKDPVMPRLDTNGFAISAVIPGGSAMR